MGSSYKEAIRVNSQSGKGGVGFLMEEHYGISLPRELLVEFAGMVQQLTEELDREVKTTEIYDTLVANYIVDTGPYKLVDYDLLSGKDENQRCVARVEISHNIVTINGEGSGPIEAFVNAMADTLNEPIVVLDYREHALGTGTDAQAICVLAIEDNVNKKRFYGLGLSRNTITASLTAIISALNRRWNA